MVHIFKLYENKYEEKQLDSAWLEAFVATKYSWVTSCFNSIPVNDCCVLFRSVYINIQQSPTMWFPDDRDREGFWNIWLLSQNDTAGCPRFYQTDLQFNPLSDMFLQASLMSCGEYFFPIFMLLYYYIFSTYILWFYLTTVNLTEKGCKYLFHYLHHCITIYIC